ncbi:flavin reductase family protein [uncultured Shimia sp.]|uniref:flavin reductase family protein n=1 Tax=uncultured Shimia sp. TaxID=573152 RepID=UPI0026028EFC|nr:flavin reductase family protein [uncultured Shimia sp.]
MSVFDPRALRNAFGSYMTGVTVVTSIAPDGSPIGFTANSFSSVSLDPPLLLVCPGKFLSTYESFAKCAQFAVNVLAEGQEDVANVFASYKGDRFAKVPHRQDALGNLLIDGALTQFSCTTHRVMDAGDHSILIGEVQDLTQTSGRGLGYAGGQFFSLGLERAALEHAGSTALGGAIITTGDSVLLERTETGYRPPQVMADNRHDLRQTLGQSLTDRALPVSLGPAYSVFDEGKTHCSYFLATTQATDSAAFETHPIHDIPKLKFASQPITDMMNRFALEAQTRSFGLYIGDAQRGDVHHLPERT